MTRTELRKSIETALVAYASDRYGSFHHQLHPQIDALIARADYFLSLVPEEPGPVYTREEDRVNAGLPSESFIPSDPWTPRP